MVDSNFDISGSQTLAKPDWVAKEDGTFFLYVPALFAFFFYSIGFLLTLLIIFFDVVSLVYFYFLFFFGLGSGA